MAIRLFILVVEDSEQDFQDIRAYVQAGCTVRGMHDATIERAKNRAQAERLLEGHEQAADALFAIFDLHVEEEHDDLTDLIMSLVRAPESSWRGSRPVIVYSQYADRIEIPSRSRSRSVAEKRKKQLLFTISKSLRSADDPRDRLRRAISSALQAVLGTGGM